MCVESTLFFCSSSDKHFKDGQLILLKLIVLKGRIVDRQNEWAITDAYPESPTICSPPPSPRPGSVIIPRVRNIFTEKMDYRTEFEKLLGGKVEDLETTPKLRPWIISSPQTSPTYIPPPAAVTETVHGMPSDESDKKTEGIEFKVPKRPL